MHPPPPQPRSVHGAGSPPAAVAPSAAAAGTKPAAAAPRSREHGSSHLAARTVWLRGCSRQPTAAVATSGGQEWGRPRGGGRGLATGMVDAVAGQWAPAPSPVHAARSPTGTPFPKMPRGQRQWASGTWLVAPRGPPPRVPQPRAEHTQQDELQKHLQPARTGVPGFGQRQDPSALRAGSCGQSSPPALPPGIDLLQNPGPSPLANTAAGLGPSSPSSPISLRSWSVAAGLVLGLVLAPTPGTHLLMLGLPNEHRGSTHAKPPFSQH